MRMVEDRFNRRYKYQWTFMNDQPFTANFIKYATGAASGPVEFIHIPREHWDLPEELNKTMITEGMERLSADKVIYGSSMTYRKMCRFNSGFFYEQEALKKFDWYWRVCCSSSLPSARGGLDWRDWRWKRAVAGMSEANVMWCAGRTQY